MKDWIVRNLPSGTELHGYHGVRAGSVVHVIGWTRPGSVDVRKVVRVVTAQCQGGVMLVLDQPLRNQEYSRCEPWISFDWTREGGAK